VADIGIASGIIIANYNLAATAFGAQMAGKFTVIADNIVQWIDTFWYYNMRPAMQEQTEQLNVQETATIRDRGGFEDASEQNRLVNQMNRVEVDSIREYQPGENVCVAGTITGGMARANVISRAYARAAPVEKFNRTDNRGGGPAAASRAGDASARFDNYVARYCNPQDNGGQSACTGGTPFMDADIDVTGQIFAKDTIDLTDPDTQRSVDDLIRNIAEPFTVNNIPPEALTSAQGKQMMLELEAYKAKRQLIYTALDFIVSRRAPGSQMGAFLGEMRDVAGVNAVDISANPSHNEIMEVMMNERFRTGAYSVDQIDSPENNEREMVIQQAFQVMQMHDQLDLMDRYALMLAAETGVEASKFRKQRSLTRVAPK
jgi:hypothetical protein